MQREDLATIQGFDEDGATVVNQFVAIGDDVFEGWQRFYFWVSQSGGTVTWRLDWYNIGGAAGGIGSTYSGTAGRVTRIETEFGASVSGLKVGHVGVFPWRRPPRTRMPITGSLVSRPSHGCGASRPGRPPRST